jgi:hypothetical protein
MDGFAMISELQSISYHEAGHCVCHLATGLPLLQASLDKALLPAGTSGAVWSVPGKGKYVCKPLREFSGTTLQELRQPPLPKLDGQPLAETTVVLIYAKTISLLAGAEGEKLIFGKNLAGRDQNDVREAAFYASFATSNLATFLELARADAARILAGNRRRLEVLAAALVEFQTLNASQIREIVEGLLTPSMMRERSRREVWASKVSNANACGLRMLERV